MKILELFSGTHSVGKILKEEGHEVVSVDINDYKGKFGPLTKKVDILKFDYKQYKPGEFDYIWASPPCIYYSSLQFTSLTGKPRKDGTIKTKEDIEKNMSLADKWVKRTLKIIKYLKPKYWFMENPQTGRLKSRKFIQKYNYHDVDYCRYSNWGYRKRTRIWTNKKDFKPLLCNKKCGNMEEGTNRHKVKIGFTDQKLGKLGRYRIPEKLIRELLL